MFEWRKKSFSENHSKNLIVFLFIYYSIILFIVPSTIELWTEHYNYNAKLKCQMLSLNQSDWSKYIFSPKYLFIKSKFVLLRRNTESKLRFIFCNSFIELIMILDYNTVTQCIKRSLVNIYILVNIEIFQVLTF